MLHYDEYGSPDPPTILLLPGAGALDTFNQQYVFADSYHLLVLHLPGSGKASGVVYDPKKTTQELFELIQNLHQKVGVIGHSLGAQIAVRLVNHDFPMRHAQTLNPLLRQFIVENLKFKI